MKTVTRKRLVEEWARERDCFWCDRPFAYRGKHAPTFGAFHSAFPWRHRRPGQCGRRPPELQPPAREPLADRG